MRHASGAAVLKISRRRTDKMLLTFVRGTFRVLRLLPTSWSARWAEQLFLTPPRQVFTRAERETLSRGRFRRIRTGRHRLATWRWGQGPSVLFVHGWGGHAGRLSRFVGPLTEAGFSVVAFDAPGHGASEGKLCDLSDFVRAVRAVARDCGGVAALVGHSLGAAAGLLAIRKGLSVRAAVLLAPLVDPEEYTGRFAAICRIPRPVRDSMKVRLAARQRVSWERLHLGRNAPSEATPLLIFHDSGDLKVPVRNGRAIAAAWPAADLVTTRGLGHHKILRDEEIARRTVSFLLRTVSSFAPEPERRAASVGRLRLGGGFGKPIAPVFLGSAS